MTRFSAIIRNFCLALVVAAAPLAAEAATPYEIIIADRAGFARAYTSGGTEIGSFATNFNTSYTVQSLTTSRVLWGVAVDQATSETYVGTENSNVVYHLSPTGAILNTITLPTPSGSVYTGLDMGPDGFVYAISNNANIVKINTVTQGASLLTSAVTGVNNYDIAAGDDGKLYVTSASNGNITRWDATTGASEGAVISFGDGATPPQLDAPEALDFDLSGNLTVVDVDRFTSPSNTVLVRHFDITPVTDIGPTWTVYADAAQTVSNINNLNVGIVIAPDGRTFVTSYNVQPLWVYDTGGTASVFTNVVGSSVGIDYLLLPEPASASLLMLGATLILKRRRTA